MMRALPRISRLRTAVTSPAAPRIRTDQPTALPATYAIANCLLNGPGRESHMPVSPRQQLTEGAAGLPALWPRRLRGIQA
jgi:hypothetical protein